MEVRDETYGALIGLVDDLCFGDLMTCCVQASNQLRTGGTFPHFRSGQGTRRLGPDYSTSILIVQKLLDGAMPGCPRLSFGVVDVRDVADLHLRAMTHPAAKDERFLAIAGDFMSMREMAQVMKGRLGPVAKRVPTREIPDWLVRLAALYDPSVRQILPELAKHKNATNAKAQHVLGWTPRSREEAIVATAESLARLRLLRDSPKIAA